MLPRHRIDATPVYIDAQDGAWDHERIKAEKAEDAKSLAEDDPPFKASELRHPFDVYQSGQTRYDLGAVLRYRGQDCRVTDYVNLAEAWQFVGKRMPHQSVYACEAAIDRFKLSGYTLACKFALQRIQGPNAPEVKREGDLCSDETIETLFQIRSDLPARVGEALFVASLALRPDEKKA